MGLTVFCSYLMSVKWIRGTDGMTEEPLNNSVRECEEKHKVAITVPFIFR